MSHHSGSLLSTPRLLFSLRMRSPCSLSRSAVYHLNFSPKSSGLVVFVLYPCGGGAPIGCGSARRLFLAPPQPRTPRLFYPLVPSIFFSALLLGPLWALSVRLISSAEIRNPRKCGGGGGGAKGEKQNGPPWARVPSPPARSQYSNPVA